MGLGDLPGGEFYSTAAAISADGSVVTGYSASGVNAGGSRAYQAFRWTASGGMVALGDLPGGPVESFGFAASADGSVIAGSSAYASTDLGGGIHQAVRYTSTGIVALGLPAATVYSYGNGISADGSVIVGTAGGIGAFRWTAGGGAVSLGTLPDGMVYSQAKAVTPDGSIAVGQVLSSDNLQAEAVIWRGGVGIGLGDLPGGRFYSDARAVSADGSVVVGAGRLGSETDHAFRWTASGGMVDLGTLPGSFANPAISLATDVSADGSTVVGEASSPTSYEAFIWNETYGMQQLDQVLNLLGVDTSDWILTFATGISADGLTIVGEGSHYLGGPREAWIAVIPEPSTGLLLMTGLLGLAYRQRRRGRAARGVHP
jgi:probable HAF family extracellular repeat protein